MKDIEIVLEDKPGQLALLGKILGENQISLEGGGVFQNGENAIAHFLVEQPEKAKRVLENSGVKVTRINNVIIQKLKQNVPGQLGEFCKELANEGINILVQYSDHANQLIVVVDDYERGKKVSDKWMKKWWNNEDYII
ncbi:amino acid-binding ACT domain-containing protein [Tenacibaculum agarivorans]|uniref:amino acid-binding ACT domain-containing protein n=1 Tax=Tenacibaculum agarivorans TaxID=1908389 RepID=UPI00094BC322|nr:amino acid-binding ACT domain-containing protein [Tenacibaculum agarivorans]